MHDSGTGESWASESLPPPINQINLLFLNKNIKQLPPLLPPIERGCWRIKADHAHVRKADHAHVRIANLRWTSLSPQCFRLVARGVEVVGQSSGQPSRKKHKKPPVAEPSPFLGQIPQPTAQRLVCGALRLVSHQLAVRAHNLARPSRAANSPPDCLLNACLLLNLNGTFRCATASRSRQALPFLTAAPSSPRSPLGLNQ